MYQDVTSSFEEKVNNVSRTFFTKLVFSDTEVIDSGMRNYKLSQQANSGTDTIELGGTVSAQIDVEAFSTEFSVISREFQLYLGIETDSAVEYIPIGIYMPQKPTYSQDKSIVTFTAYDRMVSRFERPYNTEITAYPVDAKKILQEISAMSGVPLGNLNDLPDGVKVKARTIKYGDSGKQVVAPFSGCTYRAAIGYIAQLYGRFATMNRSGELELRWYREVDYDVTADRIFNGEFGDQYTLKKIECTVTDGTLTAGDGETGISITNPVMTQEILDDIFGEIGGMSYLPYTGTFLGDPRVDLGDIITVNGNAVPVMSIKQDYDGGLTTEIGCYGNTEEEEDNPNGPTQQAIDRINEELANISGIVVYEYSNEDAVGISADEKSIIRIRYMAQKDTKAEFKAEILLNVLASAETVTATDSSGITVAFQMDGKAVLTLVYKINQEKLVTHIPVETLGSGKHIINLFYQINNIKEDTVNRFEVLAKIDGGTADIAAGGIIATISGDGFAHEVNWDGNLEIAETYIGFTVGRIKINKMTESLSAKKYTPDPATITQGMDPIGIGGISIADFTEGIEIENEEES